MEHRQPLTFLHDHCMLLYCAEFSLVDGWWCCLWRQFHYVTEAECLKYAAEAMDDESTHLSTGVH